MGTGLEPCSNPSDQGKILHRNIKRDSNVLSKLGIIPRFAISLFDRMLQLKNTFQIYTSFVELYNEEINDLLAYQESHPTIREDMNGNIYWSGIKEERVYTVDDLIRYTEYRDYKIFFTNILHIDI
jgi:hypothetical protein